MAPLIGAIVERKPNTSAHLTPKCLGSSKTGFPPAHHRSKSAFAKHRDESRQRIGLESKLVQDSDSTDTGALSPMHIPDSADWRAQISSENEHKVSEMTDEERASAISEVMDHFGPGVRDALKKAREARERRLQEDDIVESQDDVARKTAQTSEDYDLQEVMIEPRSELPRTSMLSGTISPVSAISAGSSRPSSRANRTLRFAELSPEDVHVYESAPSSPRKKALALPPPPDVPDNSIVSLGKWKGTIPDLSPPEPTETTPSNDRFEAEEGTPEYIRQRYFPNAPSDNHNIAWMQPTVSGTTEDSSIRFDLSGNPIPPSVALTLPTHLGLHHHADGNQAGYTFKDLFWLSRSSVPSQRATILSVLARIARKLGKQACGIDQDGMQVLKGTETELQKKILAAGVGAMGERGSLGVLAIEVIWECVVAWDGEIDNCVYDIELAEVPDTSAVSTLPLDYLLPQIARIFSTADLPHESLTQLLYIVHRLAQHSNALASAITTTAGLVPAIIKTFLLTPIPPTETSPPPDPYALKTLATLAISSRGSALALLQPADALLRFVTMLPGADSPSLYPTPLTTTLLTDTLRIYTVFASYGLYAHIATTASEQFALLNKHVQSDECTSEMLRSAWAALLEAWIVSATDPHRTDPTHDILWSQVVGWNWGSQLLELNAKTEATELGRIALGAIWSAEAAWLEGARVNGVKGGQEQRSCALEILKPGFGNGKDKSVLSDSIAMLRRDLDALSAEDALPSNESLLATLIRTGSWARIVSSAMRLWLAFLPLLSERPLEQPPFPLPFAELSQLCAVVVTHPFWRYMYSSRRVQAHCRSLTAFLSTFVQLSRHLPMTTEDLWLAQALAVLPRLVQGDEDFAQRIMEDTLNVVRPEFMCARAWHVPPAIWEKGGLDLIKPFFLDDLASGKEAYVGPISPTPKSISLTTTLRLPSRAVNDALGLPLGRTWMVSPLKHLLQSGSSKVFQSTMQVPGSVLTWDASEVELVRATLLLVKFAREILCRHALHAFTMTRYETVITCTNVFMLEHESNQSDSSSEVFRDGIVNQLMLDLLAPFTIAEASASLPSHVPDELDKAAVELLGPSFPFYQYYTDLVALYDAISFSHPLFARLLLPPTSMQHAVDYRKLLWQDYSHTLRTIRTPIHEVIASSVAEYLWPVESDGRMIGAYMQALFRAPLDGLVRLVAVHHIACNIWPELRPEGANEERAGKLLRAVLTQGPVEVVKEVVLYRQDRQISPLLPPACFEQGGDWRLSRLEVVKTLVSVGMAESLSKLLVRTTT